MANLNNFNANTVDPADEFEAIPAGKYLAVITESETKATKSGNGSYLKLTFDIIEGEFKGRKLWAQLNLDNPSQEAVRIARGQLSSICRAVGVLTPKDSIELHNLPLVVSVKQKADADGEVRNEIRAFSRRESLTGAKPAQNANATPPWRR